MRPCVAYVHRAELTASLRTLQLARQKASRMTHKGRHANPLSRCEHRLAPSRFARTVAPCFLSQAALRQRRPKRLPDSPNDARPRREMPAAD